MAIDAPAFPDHPYLTGPFEPVHDELVTGDLPVRGRLPAGLRGTFLRNGGNPAFPPIGRFHIFDGDGMVHALEVDEGRARYRNRFVESAGLLAERRAGRALFGGLSEFVMPPADVVAEAGVIKNTANTHVIRHAARILALMEGCKPTELTPELDTVGEWDFDGALAGSMTAHPKIDPVSGELVFFGYNAKPPYLRYHVADAVGRLIRSEPIDLPGPVMMHDFAVTERNVIFFDLPAVFDVDAFIAGGTSVSWQPEKGARIGVLPRDGGNDDIRWIEVEPFYVFHFLNAFDHGDGSVVVDGCRAERLPTAFGDDVLDGPVQPALHRWHIDVAAGDVHDEAVDDRPVDFHRVSPLIETRPTASATPRTPRTGTPRSPASTASSSTTWPRAGPRPTCSAGAWCRASRCSPRPRRRRPRTAAGCSPTSRTWRPAPRPSRSSTPATCRPGRSRRCSCPGACRSASTAPGRRPDVRRQSACILMQVDG